MKKIIKTIALALFIVPLTFAVGVHAKTAPEASKVMVNEIDKSAEKSQLLAKGQNNLPKQKSHKSCG